MNRTISGSANLLRNADVGHMLELREKLAESQALCGELLFVLKAIMSDLPQKRDWLNPSNENFAKYIIAKSEKTTPTN